VRDNRFDWFDEALAPSGVVVLGCWLATQKSRVRLPVVPLAGNNLGQVVHTHVPLSPSAIIWYLSKGGDALRLGR